jgi:hypothetical protein
MIDPTEGKVRPSFLKKRSKRLLFRSLLMRVDYG